MFLIYEIIQSLQHFHTTYALYTLQLFTATLHQSTNYLLLHIRYKVADDVIVVIQLRYNSKRGVETNVIQIKHNTLYLISHSFTATSVTQF